MSDEFSDILEELKAEYREKLEERLGTLHAWLTDVRAGQRLPEAEEALDIAHHLAGTGSSFGFPVVTEICKEFETFLVELIERGGLLGDGEIERMRELFERLQTGLADAG